MGRYSVVVIKLNKLLIDKQMTQKDLAMILGLSMTTVSKITNHKTKTISFELLDTLCKILDCDVKDILEYRDYSSESQNR